MVSPSRTSLTQAVFFREGVGEGRKTGWGFLGKLLPAKTPKTKTIPVAVKKKRRGKLERGFNFLKEDFFLA